MPSHLTLKVPFHGCSTFGILGRVAAGKKKTARNPISHGISYLCIPNCMETAVLTCTALRNGSRKRPLWQIGSPFVTPVAVLMTTRLPRDTYRFRGSRFAHSISEGCGQLLHHRHHHHQPSTTTINDTTTQGPREILHM